VERLCGAAQLAFGSSHLSMDENEIVAAVCTYLTQAGYTVEQRLHTTEHGVDVIARNPSTGRRIVVEAKGGTSSREGSARYGKPYTQTQVFDRVAKGIYTALQLRSSHPDRTQVEVALAVPDSRWFRGYLGRVAAQLEDAGITVLVVGSECKVSPLRASTA
jgi:hypothetical protein